MTAEVAGTICPGCGGLRKDWGHGEKEKSYPNGCFTCEFWSEKIKWAEEGDPLAVRVDGRHYHIGEENADPRGFRGFSGAKFVILFHDGRSVTSTNMWHQGTIPEMLRHLMPDNAVFIHEEKGKQP